MREMDFPALVNVNQLISISRSGYFHFSTELTSIEITSYPYTLNTSDLGLKYFIKN